MKKLFLILCSIILCFSTISCKKNCVCQIRGSGATYTVEEKGKMSSKECKKIEKEANEIRRFPVTVCTSE